MDKPMFCRCCLSTNDLLSVFTTCDTPEKVLMYADMIKRCFFIEMWSREDNDPLICSPCIQRLQDAYHFRTQIQSIQDLLGNATVILSKNGKIVIRKSDRNKKIEYERESYSELREKTDLDRTVLTQTQTEDHKTNTLTSPSVCKVLIKNSLQTKNKLKEKSDEISPISVENQKETNLNQNAQEIESITRDQREYKTKRLRKDNELLSCQTCEMKFTNQFHLDSHMTVHSTNFICDYCGQRFSTKRCLYIHLMRHIPNKEPCKICGKLLQNPNNMSRHMKTHSGTKSTFPCSKCSERFNTYYSRQKHLGKVHNVDVYKFKCDSCDLSFCVSGKLRAHIRNVHLKLKRHACTECPSAFYSRNCLKSHMLKHTGEKNYTCKVCNKSYARRFTLNEHMRIHNNDKRFTCQECGRSFTQKCTLNGHLRGHVKQQDMKVNNKVYE